MRRSKWLRACGIAALGLACLAPTASLAHHSFSAFNRSEAAKRTIRGKITEFGLVNPHGWLKLSVAEPGGKSSTWTFELSSATQLLKQGWSTKSLKVGQHVEAAFYPLRFGSFGGLLHSVRLPGGHVLVGTAEPDRGYPKPVGTAR